MNRYPIWKYGLILIALLCGTIYSLPNFFGESPAIQVNSVKATLKVDESLLLRIKNILTEGGITPSILSLDMGRASASVIRARFVNTDQQFKAKTLLEQHLNTDPHDLAYLVAFNLMPNTPAWLQRFGASPMFLGLDLRGGVHFLMQVDIQAVTDRRLQGMQISMRSLLREKKIRYRGMQCVGDTVEVHIVDPQTLGLAHQYLLNQLPDIHLEDRFVADGSYQLIARLKSEVLKRVIDEGIQQNISTLSKRVNELGVSEPVIQRQGLDRIVVQLPGVQDVGRAKDIIGRTATLEVRMVDESIVRGMEVATPTPFGSELFKVGRGAPVVLSKEPVLTGDVISNAAAGFDQNHQPTVNISLNAEGGRKMRQATRTKIGKLMAVVLFEKGKGEVLTVATIQSELGATFQITGIGTTQEAADLALLMRAGSLAAPMEIIEERTIGPQLGAENIKKGFHATLYGFIAVAVFMTVYYLLFGFFSVLALSVNLLLLVAALSLLQATLTLPGIAAIALTLGMAIDANVLINERIREELRKNYSPQVAIARGFDHAWHTIFDSNITTLIAGIALLIFGSGAIRGFAVVHCLGILTSMFSAVFFARGLANLWYGYRRGLKSLSIGQG